MKRENGVPNDARAISSNDHILFALLLTLAAAMTALIVWLKLGELYTWRYTSDLFTYDQIMQEILRGHFGLEYTYGNQFGDHALLWLVLMAPLKFLLGKYMVVFLVVLGPLVYAISAVLLFVMLRRQAGSLLTFFGATAYLGTLLIVRGLSEEIYGCHLDTLSGFIATMLTVLLVARQQTLDAEAPARRLTIAIWVMLALFMCLKEEMALLAIVFFGVVCALRPNRFHVTALGVAVGAFIVEMILIRLCASPWNRTNEALLAGFMDMLLGKGSGDAASTPPIAGMCAAVLVFLSIFTTLAVSAGKPNPYALGLLAIGLSKLALGFVVKDTELKTWHNFPGVVMLTGAVVIQMVAAIPAATIVRRSIMWTIAGGAVATAIVLFITVEVPFVTTTHAEQVRVRTKVVPPAIAKERQRALAEAKAKIDPHKITAICGNTALDWSDGWRYSFFPRGVLWSPQGIADYIVVDVPLLEANMGDYFTKDGLKEFTPILQTKYVILLKRHAIRPEAAPQREKFVRYFGPAAIGGAEKFPVAKVASSPTTSTGRL